MGMLVYSLPYTLNPKPQTPNPKTPKPKSTVVGETATKFSPLSGALCESGAETTTTWCLGFRVLGFRVRGLGFRD